jgi:hypothetical protein
MTAAKPNAMVVFLIYLTYIIFDLITDLPKARTVPIHFLRAG